MAKILLVEDDPLIISMYTKAFTLEGYEVVVARNGEEGVIKASTDNPTLVLMDVMMPKMNGLQALERLKADVRTKTIPVIMLTNLYGEQDAEAALKKGAINYLNKSEFEPHQLLVVIKDIINKITASQTHPTIPTT